MRVRRRVTVDITVLRESRDLRLVVIGEAISGLGTQAALVAIPYQVYTLTHSAALVGLLGIVELGPLVAASLLGGAAADRVDRRRILLRRTGRGRHGRGPARADGAARRHLGPADLRARRRAGGRLARSTTSRARRSCRRWRAALRLRSALSITFGLNQVCAVVGPGVGGLLIAATGVGSAYLVLTAGFVITLFITALLSPMPALHLDGPALPVVQSIGEGLRFVRGNRALVGSFAIDLAAMTFGMPRALFAVLSLTVYDAGAAGTGLLYASVSAGATVAALTTGWLEHANRLGRIVIGAVCVWGLAIAAAGLVPSLWIAAGLLAVAGAADSVSAVCRSTINQTVTPEAMRGRMSSVFMLVVTSGPRLGDLEAGVVASLSSAAFAVTSGGLACLAAVGVILVAFPALAAYDVREAAPT